MGQWIDPFTGTTYLWESEWEEQVRSGLASSLQSLLTSDAAHSANAVARFWKEQYYRTVFPLRYGCATEGAPYAHGVALYTGSPVHLSESAIRQHFLDGTKHPPLLTARTDPSLLVADHHLAVSALLNGALRRLGVDANILHQVRLGALVHELSDLVDLSAYPLAQAVAKYLDGRGECPSVLSECEPLLRGIHESRPELLDPGLQIALVGVAAQRIKQYVYESPGLP
ncbi:MAG: hypothetical protein SNJ72_11170, partial [Fimbriimonadales bacterium]